MFSNGKRTQSGVGLEFLTVKQESHFLLNSMSTQWHEFLLVINDKYYTFQESSKGQKAGERGIWGKEFKIVFKTSVSETW